MPDEDRRAEIAAALREARTFVEEVHGLRLPRDMEEGELPFGTIDYYGMEDLIEKLGAAADLLDRLEGVAYMVRYEPCGCEIPCKGRVGPKYACPKSGHEDSYATTNTPLYRRTHQTPEEGEITVSGGRERDWRSMLDDDGAEWDELRYALEGERVDGDSLEYRLSVQNGSGGTQEEHEAAMKGWDKISGSGPDRFGDPVEIRFRWEDGDDVFEWSEHGYITTLPGHTEPDMDGVIHLPETRGEKCAGDPVWITVLDAAALPDVEEIIIGSRRLQTDQGETP